MHLTPNDRLLAYMRAIVPSNYGIFQEEKHCIHYSYDWTSDSSSDTTRTKHVFSHARLSAYIMDSETDENTVMNNHGVDRYDPEWMVGKTPYKAIALPDGAKKIMHIGLRYYIAVTWKPWANSSTGVRNYCSEEANMTASFNLYSVPAGTEIDGKRVPHIDTFLNNVFLRDEIGEWLRKKKGEYDALYLDMKDGGNELRLPRRHGYMLPVFVTLQ